MIVTALNARCAEQEKKIGGQLMEFQHRFDAKFLTLSEELIDIKSKSGSNPRLSLLEDEIKDLRRELKVCHVVHFLLLRICSSIFIIVIIIIGIKKPN